MRPENCVMIWWRCRWLQSLGGTRVTCADCQGEEAEKIFEKNSRLVSAHEKASQVSLIASLYGKLLHFVDDVESAARKYTLGECYVRLNNEKRSLLAVFRVEAAAAAQRWWWKTGWKVQLSRLNSWEKYFPNYFKFSLLIHCGEREREASWGVKEKKKLKFHFNSSARAAKESESQVEHKNFGGWSEKFQ